MCQEHPESYKVELWNLRPPPPPGGHARLAFWLGAWETLLWMFGMVRTWSQTCFRFQLGWHFPQLPGDDTLTSEECSKSSLGSDFEGSSTLH